MAVYTQVTAQDAQTLLNALGLGQLEALQGCAQGIENTNYFLSARQGGPTHGQTRDYVLTLFERLSAEQLPFYLYLMQHLARHGLPVPAPQANAEGELLHHLAGKPAALVNRLAGRGIDRPTPGQCAALGQTLAQMHLAARDYPRTQPNLRGLEWWNATAPTLLPHLDATQANLLQSELAYQNHVAQTSAYAALPRGAVHADLFRDNALFLGDDLSGVFDFYFAGVDSWLYDLAVCLNDWCLSAYDGESPGTPGDALDALEALHSPPHFAALLLAYQRVRPLSAAERALLPAMLRAAALRFWLTRLADWHLPRPASLLQPKDPGHFERVLRLRVVQTGRIIPA